VALPGLSVSFTVPLNAIAIVQYTIGGYVNSNSGSAGSGAEVGLFSDAGCTTAVGNTVILNAINDGGQAYMTAMASSVHVNATAGSYTYYLCARRSYAPGSTTTYFAGTGAGMIVSSNGTATTGAGPWQVPGIQGRMAVQVVKK